jgi:Domain of unknown function (DUF397)
MTVRNETLNGLAWRKSSACWDSQCVTIASHDGRVLVRDSGDADKTIIAINRRDWAAFVVHIRDTMKGQF